MNTKAETRSLNSVEKTEGSHSIFSNSFNIKSRHLTRDGHLGDPVHRKSLNQDTFKSLTDHSMQRDNILVPPVMQYEHTLTSCLRHRPNASHTSFSPSFLLSSPPLRLLLLSLPLSWSLHALFSVQMNISLDNGIRRAAVCGGE